MSTVESRIETLLGLGRSIHRRRPDLQAAFSDPNAAPFWIWLQTHGCVEHPEVLDASIPLPPDDIQRRVNTGNSWDFLLNGASIYTLLLRVLAERGNDLADVGPVLDFGCGSGRSLRFFLSRARHVEFVGTDVDAAAIDWCRKNFPFGTFYCNREKPPMDLAPSTFGFGYAISVFSHLPEARQRDWLGELARVMRPDGTLVITVHGRHALRRAATEGTMLRVLGISQADLARAESDVDRNGFAFVRQSPGFLNRTAYGMSFVTEDYVRRHWETGFDCISYEAAALGDWQDVVVLRRSRLAA